jgi:hypothetical protein
MKNNINRPFGGIRRSIMTPTSRPSAIFAVAKEMEVSPSFARKLVIESSNEWLSMNAFNASPEKFMSALESELSYFVDNDLIQKTLFA